MEKTNFDRIVDYLNDCELPAFASQIAQSTDILLADVLDILHSENIFVQVKRGKGRPKKDTDIDYGAWFLDRKVLSQLI